MSYLQITYEFDCSAMQENTVLSSASCPEVKKYVSAYESESQGQLFLLASTDTCRHNT